MIKHIVLWKLKEFAEGSGKAENARRIKAELEALRGKIPGLLSLEVGINCNPAEQDCDAALCCAFESWEALERYQNHPEHVKVAGWIGKVRETRTALDCSV